MSTQLADDRMYTLADGREFPWDSELPRIERAVMATHIAAMSRADEVGRAAYLEHVQNSEGLASREKLEKLFAWAVERNSK